MKSTMARELKVYTLCALLVARTSIYAGSITFLFAYGVSLMQAIPLPDNFVLIVPATAFIVGGLYAARQLIDVTNPNRLEGCPRSRARIWLWPFLTFSWAAVFFANPYLLVVGVLTEGFVAAYAKNIT